MKEKKECKIVQDLLPYYVVEKFTNNETNEFVENHINECKECKEIYENFKKEQELVNNKSSEFEIDYMKKYKRKLFTTVIKTIIFIIFIAIFVYAIFVIPRFFTIRNLNEKFEEISKSKNYSYIEETIPNASNYSKIYRKDNIYKKVYVSKDTNAVISFQWVNVTTKEAYVIDEVNKTYTKFNNNFAFETITLLPSTYLTNSKLFEGGIMTQLKYAMNLSNGIKDRYYNYEIMDDCYVFDMGYGGNVYIEKETGLIKAETGDISALEGTKYSDYKFEQVTDEDIQMPDLTNYTLKAQ